MVFSVPSLSPAFPLVLLTMLICTTSLALGVAITQLPADEVAALKDIAESLGKMNWDFNKDPCGEDGGWGKPGTDNAVTCSNSSFSGNNTIRHVISIRLMREGLNGTLPPHLNRLPYLLDFDVTRNYLNGTIPPEWGAHPNLLNISVLGNRLTGPIPKELGNISTLQSLVLMVNQFSGDLPPDLGNLSRLERLHLLSNNFTGELPATFANLTALKELVLGDNQFQGEIPDFIQNFTHLQRLNIQASGLQGPIPSRIGLLTNLVILRIAYLNQIESPIPQLNCTQIEELVLRNCNLIGGLPKDLWRMPNLKILDLSFNKLSGEIPGTFASLPDSLAVLLLTGNQLTGVVPEWMLKARKIVDLSYNNFMTEGKECQERNVNLFASSSEVDNKTLYSTTNGLVSCLKNFKCPRSWDYVAVNCGGAKLVIGNTTYDDDTSLVSISSFFRSINNNWAYSSTGYILDPNNFFDPYTSLSDSQLPMDNALYSTARLSPLSLTYYGYCLNNGNYSVSLHFAEIMFTDDKNYSSLGRRVFDVYIQGTKVMEDFNIEVAAGGVGKPIVKNFNTMVSNGALEVRFYWAGKGTTIMPENYVYGPLISAISMKNLEPAKQSDLSAGTVVGIVVGIVVALNMILIIIWWKSTFRWRDTRAQDLEGLDLQIGSFTLRQIKAATDNFNIVNKIGEGGFGSVYKGLLLDGTPIAVKQLSSKSKQGNREFVNEIGMISALQHPHLVQLHGCCTEGNQLLLVYEYMENNSLARALFGPKEFQLRLDWPTRQKICLGIARGLTYLHEESRLKIVHRDIKATNILLDVDLNPKISDFGLAKLDEESNSHISTRIAGTHGYMAPEYAMHGYLTEKADIYSFGIVALEIVSGSSNASYWRKDECFNLLDWARVLKETGNLVDLVDQRLGSHFDEKEAMAMISVALLCSNSSHVLRPAMSLVVSMLEGKTGVPAPSTEGGVIDKDKFEAMRKHFIGIEGQEKSEYISQSRSVDGPWIGTASSTAGADLYPILLDFNN